MATQIGKYSVLQRITPMVLGFDTVLSLTVLVLALIGLLTIFSSGYAEGQRFIDHGRNMVLAFIIMMAVAQIPPQRIMTLAVPVYTVGLALLVAVAIFGLTKKGAQRWLNIGVVIQPSEIMKIGMPLMLSWWFQKREGQLRSLDFLVASLILFIPVGLIVKQ
ncbi:MAG: rod shape-determining protein RodA, partial [Betaproteobacteria bacterium]|nr:rod shape-determining protein RodA [Betaproteobacteria bacterium]